jgi:hypothetical protein
VKKIAAAIVVLLAAGGEASAHRLDEYLQATRISLARDRLMLEVDLTPGANIASDVAAILDVDGDKAISPAEAEVYGRAVLSDLVVQFDDRVVGMTLMHVEVPSIDEMRHGLGTIHLRAAGDIEAAMGRHQLLVLNRHRPGASVYMVNALVPEDSGVELIAQSRDPQQREFRAEYTVSPRWPMGLLWLGMCGVGLVALAAVRRGRV